MGKKEQEQKQEPIPEATAEEVAAYMNQQGEETNEERVLAEPVQTEEVREKGLAALKNIHVGPPTPDSVAAQAVRMAERAHLRTPDERSQAEEARRAANAAKRESQEATVIALNGIPEEAKLVYLRALMTVEVLGNKPERLLSDEDRKELREAGELVQSMGEWPAAAKKPYYDGFLETQNQELKLGFNSWKKGHDAELARQAQERRDDFRARERAFREGTVYLHEALETGEGLVALWVRYPLLRMEGDRRVPVVENGREKTASGLIKLRIENGAGVILDKLDERRPPHVHADPERVVPLHPENDFRTPKGQYYWHDDVRNALVSAYAEGKERAAEREARRQVDEEISSNLATGTISVGDLIAGLSGEKGAKKTGIISINNPHLRRDPRNPEKGTHHLAFSLQVKAKGVATVGQYWYSSSHEDADLSAILGRDLRVELAEGGTLRVTDPGYSDLDQGTQRAVRRICGKITGALRAQMIFEQHRAEQNSGGSEDEGNSQ